MAVIFVLLGASSVFAIDTGHTNVAPVLRCRSTTGGPQRFFPFGWYVNRGQPGMSWQDLAANGMNTVLLADVVKGTEIINGTDQFTLVASALDAMQTYNIKVIIEFNPGLLSDDIDPVHNWLRSYVSVFRNHPALLGWQLGDENPGNVIPSTGKTLTSTEVVQCAALVRSLDPNHQIWQVFAGLYTTDYPTVTAYMSGTDVLSTDQYFETDDRGLFQGAGNTLYHVMNGTQLASDNHWPYVVTPQGFGADDCMSAPDIASRRIPDPAEYRWNVFSALAACGARGVLNWIMSADQFTPGVWFTDPNQFRNFINNGVAPVFAELRQIQYGMENGYNVGHVDVSSSQVSQLLLYDRLANKYFLILVNKDFSGQSTTVTLSSLPVGLSALTVQVPRTSQTFSLTNLGNGTYRFTDYLNNHEVKIYSLSSTPVPSVSWQEPFNGVIGSDIGTLGWTRTLGNQIVISDYPDPAMPDLPSARGQGPANTLNVYEKSVNLSLAPGDYFEITYRVHVCDGGADTVGLTFYGTGGESLADSGHALKVSLMREYPGSFQVHGQLTQDNQVNDTRDGYKNVASADLCALRIISAPGDGTRFFVSLNGGAETELGCSNPDWAASGFKTISKIQITMQNEYSTSNSGPFLDSIQVQSKSPSNLIRGTVNLRDYAPGPNGVPVIVELKQNGSVVRTDNVTLDSSGQFVLGEVAAGTYDVRVKGATWLAATHPGVVVSAGTDAGTFELVNGDIDGDNEITSSDLAILLSNAAGSSQGVWQEPFTGTAGSDLTSLGWTFLSGPATMQVSNQTIDQGQSGKAILSGAGSSLYYRKAVNYTVGSTYANEDVVVQWAMSKNGQDVPAEFALYIDSSDGSWSLLDWQYNSIVGHRALAMQMDQYGDPTRDYYTGVGALTACEMKMVASRGQNPTFWYNTAIGSNNWIQIPLQTEGWPGKPLTDISKIRLWVRGDSQSYQLYVDSIKITAQTTTGVDLNGSGTSDSTDLAILLSNMDQVGQ